MAQARKRKNTAAAEELTAEPVAAPAAAPPSLIIPHTTIRNKSGPPTPLSEGTAEWERAYTPSAAYLHGANDAKATRYLPPTWVTAWMVATTLIVAWDAGYQLLQPWSMDATNPIAHAIWKPYHTTYSQVDLLYGSASKDPWSVTQSSFNVVEIVLQLVYLALARAGSSFSTITGFTVSLMTFYKTVLYFAIAYNGNWATVPSVAAGDWSTLFWLYILPNGIWIVVPFLVCLNLGTKLADAVFTLTA